MALSLMYRQTITLYNHYRALRVDHWQRTVLDRTQYIESFEKTMTSDGVIKIAPVATVNIANRSGFVSPAAFQVVDVRSGLWTLNAENNLDAIVYGKCTQEITSAYLLDDLIKEHGAKVIKSSRDFTKIHTAISRLKHWAVICT